MLQAQLEAARTRQEAKTELYRDKTVELLNKVIVRVLKYNERLDVLNAESA